MTVINNITKVLLDNKYTGKFSITLNIFKDSLTQLLLINTMLYSLFFNNIAQNNKLLYLLDFEKVNKEENGLEISYNGKNYYITKIFIKKSNKYKNYKKNYISFNIIGFYLQHKSIQQEFWVALSYFRNDTYSAIKTNTIFKGSTLIKENTKKIIMYADFLSQTGGKEIDIKNLINFNNNNLLCGYKNKIVNILK